MQRNNLSRQSGKAAKISILNLLNYFNYLTTLFFRCTKVEKKSHIKTFCFIKNHIHLLINFLGFHKKKLL
jgi:hypothetical protein